MCPSLIYLSDKAKIKYEDGYGVQDCAIGMEVKADHAIARNAFLFPGIGAISCTKAPRFSS